MESGLKQQYIMGRDGYISPFKFKRVWKVHVIDSTKSIEKALHKMR